MRLSRRWIVLVMVIGLLALSACGGTNTPETDTDEAGKSEATQETAPKEEPEEEATEEPTAEPEEEPTDVPEATATSEASSSGGTESDSARTLDEIDSINSYRATIRIELEGEAFESDDEIAAIMAAGMAIQIAVVKEPPAESMEMEMGPLGTISYILVDGKAYSGLGGEWFETPTDEIPEISELTAGLDVEEMAQDIERLERVGEEELNGRTTIHYRGDREAMGDMSGDDESMSEIEEGSIELWIDKEEGFVVRMNFDGTGTGLNPDEPEAEGTIRMEMEYFDFNEELAIEAPEDTTSFDDLGGDLGLGGDPAEVLGFELADLPDGVTLDSFGSLVTFTLPDTTLAEATSYIQEQMSANGYALDEASSLVDAGLLYFDGEGRISAILSEVDDGVEFLLTKE